MELRDHLEINIKLLKEYDCFLLLFRSMQSISETEDELSNSMKNTINIEADMLKKKRTKWFN